jgi:alkylhydroperoxidase family enzyme
MTSDPHAVLRDCVLDSVLRGKGESDPALRLAVAAQNNVPDELKEVVDKIHRHAYKVTDEDISRLQTKYSDDQLFELVVSAAIGASRERLLAGLDALEKA